MRWLGRRQSENVEDLRGSRVRKVAVGDDRIMKKTQDFVVPDAFTHGTSQQRVYWFTLGFKTGDLSQGNTFAATELD